MTFSATLKVMSKPDPPRPTQEQVAAAAERIRRRHRDADHHLDDGDGPQGIIDYLRKHGAAGLRAGPRDTHDVTDLLILNLDLHWRQQDNERWALRASERLGLNRRRTGRVLGLGVGQALVDRLRRLEARLGLGAGGSVPAPDGAGTGRDRTAVALATLARHLVRTAAEWYDDDLDLMVDPGLLADQLARSVDLRAALAYLVGELDAERTSWSEGLDAAANDALRAARPHLIRRPSAHGV